VRPRMPSRLYRTLVPTGSRRERWLWIARVTFGKLREGPGPWWRAVKKGIYQSLPGGWQRSLHRGSLQRFRAVADLPFEGPESGVEQPGLVSVILPVKDQADLLADAVASVLAQTYQHLELIVLDDGSSEDVAAALAPFRSDPRLRHLRQINQGLPKALSTAFELATGEFHTWTSADNIMLPQHLERHVAFLRAHAEHAMVFSDYALIDDRGAPMTDGEFRIVDRTDARDRSIVRANRPIDALNSIEDNFIGPCFLYRGRAGRLLGPYNPELGLEDYDYWLRMNRLFGIAHLGSDEVLYRYRVHDNTLSARARELRLIERAKLLMAYERQREAWFTQMPRLLVDGANMTAIADAAGSSVHAGPLDSDTNPTPHERTLHVVDAATLPRYDLPRLPASSTIAAHFATSAEVWLFGPDLHHHALIAFCEDTAIAAQLSVFGRKVFMATQPAKRLELALRHHADHTFFTTHRSQIERDRVVPSSSTTEPLRFCVIGGTPAQREAFANALREHDASAQRMADDTSIEAGEVVFAFDTTKGALTAAKRGAVFVVLVTSLEPTTDDHTDAPHVRAWLGGTPHHLAHALEQSGAATSQMAYMPTNPPFCARPCLHLAHWLRQGGAVASVREHLRRLGSQPR
jgi:glycosyltransferase involved in cell wall biosynthesis